MDEDVPFEAPPRKGGQANPVVKAYVGCLNQQRNSMLLIPGYQLPGSFNRTNRNSEASTCIRTNQLKSSFGLLEQVDISTALSAEDYADVHVVLHRRSVSIASPRRCRAPTRTRKAPTTTYIATPSDTNFRRGLSAYQAHGRPGRPIVVCGSETTTSWSWKAAQLR